MSIRSMARIQLSGYRPGFACDSQGNVPAAIDLVRISWTFDKRKFAFDTYGFRFGVDPPVGPAVPL